jgi:wyosine [tRNA(Phe)-imidazoG37] synthetase (radical SAM superfamily)
MAILFGDIVFGPVKSRRFGVSLGINLLPLSNKVCNFNCIYCECGWTDLQKAEVTYFPAEEILQSIEDQFKHIISVGSRIDHITFAGNGEPTMHPQFADIIEATVQLRNRYMPSIKIAVLSNGALLAKKRVIEALKLVDQRVMKLDAGTNDTFQKIDMPLASRPISWYIEKYKEFNGDLTVQTIFLKGIHNNHYIDNTIPEEINEWIKALQEIKPSQVMMYTIDRETPAAHLKKIPAEELKNICDYARANGVNANIYL